MKRSETLFESRPVLLHNLEMQEVEGQRKGSVLYLHNDYLYRRDKERNGIKYSCVVHAYSCVVHSHINLCTDY